MLPFLLKSNNYDYAAKDIAKSCGALLDADLSYKDEFSFTFIDLQQSMQVNS